MDGGGVEVASDMRVALDGGKGESDQVLSVRERESWPWIKRGARGDGR